MAGVKGLEPSAFAVTGRRCNQLNYTPALKSLGVNKRVDEQEVVDMTDKVNADSKFFYSFFISSTRIGNSPSALPSLK